MAFDRSKRENVIATTNCNLNLKSDSSRINKALGRFMFIKVNVPSSSSKLGLTELIKTYQIRRNNYIENSSKYKFTQLLYIYILKGVI